MRANNEATINVISTKNSFESGEFKKEAKDNDVNIVVMNINPSNMFACDEMINSFIRRDIILWIRQMLI